MISDEHQPLLPSLQCELVPASTLDQAELRQSWQMLFAKAKAPSPFISWAWLSLTIELAPHQWWLQRCLMGDRLVGLAIWFETTKGFRRQLWLHKTGVDERDRIWIEHNDLLVEDGPHAALIQQSMLDFLLSQRTLKVDEYHIHMSVYLPSIVQQQLCGQRAWWWRETLASPGFVMSLSESLEQAFSKNTRYQLRRTEQELDQRGEVQVRERLDKSSFLSEFAAAHQQQWQAEPWGSAFTNPYFSAFHQQFAQTEACRMLEMLVAGHVVARGYYMVEGTTVFFYASALQADSNPKVKVGYLFHWLAMQYFAKQGFKKYDFMAGDMQYKRSLSTEQYAMTSVVIERKDGYAQIRQCLRIIKRVMKEQFKLTK